VRSVSAVAPGDRLGLELRDGRIEAEALSVGTTSGQEPAASIPPAAQPTPAVRRPRSRGGSSQGSLF
jgi:hypothetical protein